MSASISNPAEEPIHTIDTPASASASLSYAVQASTLRKSSHIPLTLSSRPCRITSLSTSKPGKHGHANLAITAVDIFTGKKYEHVCPAHGTEEVPAEVSKREDVVLDVDVGGDGGWLSLLDEVKGEVREDVRVPKEGEVREGIERVLKEERGRGLLWWCWAVWGRRGLWRLRRGGACKGKDLRRGRVG